MKNGLRISWLCTIIGFLWLLASFFGDVPGVKIALILFVVGALLLRADTIAHETPEERKKREEQEKKWEEERKHRELMNKLDQLNRKR